MCSICANFYKDLLKNNTFMAIKTSTAVYLLFSNMADICILRNKDKFFVLATTSLLLCILLRAEV